MVLINTANQLYSGNSIAKKAFRGDTLVWEWTPDKIPGLAMWLDTAQDTFTDGELVSTYVSHTPSGLILTAPPGSEPVYRAATGTLDFTTDWFTHPGINVADDGFTAVAVATRNLTDNIGLIVSLGGTDIYDMRCHTNLLEFVIDYPVTLSSMYHPGRINDWNPHIMGMRVNRTTDTTTGWLDNEAHTWATAIPVRNPLLINIGNRGDTYAPYSGSMYEVLIYDRVLTDSAMTMLMSYLTTKHLLYSL